MVRTGYECHHVARNTGRTGGGVGVMYKPGISTILLSSFNHDTAATQFKYIKRTTKNGFKTSDFFQE